MTNIKKESTTLVKKCIVDALLLLMNEKEFVNMFKKYMKYLNY